MTPLERAARAAWQDWMQADEDVWDDCPPNWREHMTSLVRAVLSAIREPGVDVIDQPRGMIMYFNHMQQQKWSLGQHADAGGYPFEVSLTPDKRVSNHFPKAHQAALIWRVMIDKLLEEGA